MCVCHRSAQEDCRLHAYVFIRSGMIHVFVPNLHGTDITVRCMRPYNEYKAIVPQSRRGARSNATLFENRQQKNSNAMSCALENKAH